jgi:endonuclease YncB( thermonuclease family)
MQFRRRPQAPSFWPQRRRGRILRGARPIVLAAILAILWAVFDPLLVEPPAFLAGEPESVSGSFSRCGRGRSFACVIDGDTFKLGQRRVRIIGIDAPETQHARCPEEARLGERATATLQQLLNEGPFEMVAPAYERQDRYGRDLRVIRRTHADGGTQSIAEEMRETGLAHRYMGGFKPGWC